MRSGSIGAFDLKNGDNLRIVRPTSKNEQTLDNPEFAEALEAAQGFMRAHPTAMKALSK